ncbi:MAG: tail fiber domain-containing protein [Acidobacteriota bacterium]
MDRRLLCLLTLLACLPALAATPPQITPAADMTRVDWTISERHAGATLTVAAPDGRVFSQVAAPGETLAFVPAALDSQLPDGRYDWQVVLAPVLDADQQRDLAAARHQPGRVHAVQTRAVSGTFVLAGGLVVWDADALEPTAGSPVPGPRPKDGAPAAKQFIPEDLIVEGSTCIGVDCVDGETFGFDTLRLDESNLRLHFDDTSTTGFFPRNDWRIVANDTANGGGEFWALEDATASDQPLRVTAGAGPNALYVDAAGDVGLGTATPVLELHIADGDTPGLRLEQDTSAGLTAQSWDLAGDETSLFVRDVTNASSRPLQIEAAAEDDSVIVASGRVGLFTDSPTAALHVRRSDETAKILVEETNGTASASARTLLQLTNNGKLGLRMADTNSGNTWKLENDPNAFLITLDGSGATEFGLTNSGSVVITGTLTEGSDIARKDSFQPIDPGQILSQVTALPLSTWSYIDDPSGARHIGPMAQDFFAAFGLGGTATGIQPRNLSAVALAAIQGLHAELEAKERRIEELEAGHSQLEELERRLRQLEAHKITPQD